MSARETTGLGARTAAAAGLVVALLVHTAVIGGLLLVPSAKASPSNSSHASVEGASCTTVVSSCRVSGGLKAISNNHGSESPRARRCPEPIRRLLRRGALPAPRVEVDLLRAELVENLGDPLGTISPLVKPSRTAEQQPAVERVLKVKRLISTSKLGKILKGGKKADKRRSKLGRILGTRKGKVGGDALISRKGSAYVRDVRLDMQRNFILPGTVPVWLRKTLKARVRITRMTVTGRVLSYRVVKKSGNEAFDRTVRALLSGYKVGSRSLPEPPLHVLREINSRGLLIILRGG